MNLRSDFDPSRLRGSLNGTVIEPGDPLFDRATTIFYGGFDRQPAVVARVADAEDVARVVSFATESGVDLAVRSGGHSLAGHSLPQGGIVLDLTELRQIDIDVASRTAWAGTGATAGAYTAATGAHGLATGFGDAPSVGLGGITLAGGVGFLVRKHGMSIDSLQAAEVVTADGRILQVNAENHPDLFWAIRGGGGNFGVATRLQFRLHEVDRIVGGMLALPATPEVIEGFIAEAAAAPDELSAIANVMVAPPAPFVPPPLVGKLTVLSLMAYSGDVADGKRTVDRFRALAEPLADMVSEIRYPDLLAEEPGEEFHPRAVSHNGFRDTVDSTVAKRIVDGIESSTAPMRVVQLRVLGGAMARVPADATAFAHRSRPIMANIGAMYEDESDVETHRGWVKGMADTLRQGDDGAYSGFIADEGDDGPRRAYPEPHWSRLRDIKRRYDPDNLFHLNHNIPPT